MLSTQQCIKLLNHSCTPETNIILYINYPGIKIKTLKKFKKTTTKKPQRLTMLLARTQLLLTFPFSYSLSSSFSPLLPLCTLSLLLTFLASIPHSVKLPTVRRSDYIGL